MCCPQPPRLSTPPTRCASAKARSSLDDRIANIPDERCPVLTPSPCIFLNARLEYDGFVVLASWLDFKCKTLSSLTSSTSCATVFLFSNLLQLHKTSLKQRLSLGYSLSCPQPRDCSSWTTVKLQPWCVLTVVTADARRGV
jgi:hypothetical protein